MRKHHLTLNRPLAFLDLETTGVSVATDRIVEIAILALLPGGGSRSLVHRINPEIPIPPAATAVHGIRDADVVFEPNFRTLAPRIRDFLTECDFSGYNVRRYDLPLLVNEFKRAGLTFDLSGRHIVDAQTIFHTREPRDLSAALLYYCGRTHTGAHGAMADVEATADIFQAQLDRYTDLPKSIAELEQVIHPRHPDWVDDDGKLVWDHEEAVLNFGKYRGQSLRAVLDTDAGYVDWILGGDFRPSLKNILAEARRGNFPIKSVNE